MQEKLVITTENHLQLTIENAVRLIVSQLPVNPPIQSEVLTVKQAADFLGLSSSTIYTYISKRTIPFVKRNGTVWFLRSTLLKWLQEGEKQTIISLTKKPIRNHAK